MGPDISSTDLVFGQSLVFSSNSRDGESLVYSRLGLVRRHWSPGPMDPNRNYRRVFLGRRDVLWSAFRTLDRDGDGHISKEELLDVLNGEGVRDSFGQAKVEKMIREVDSAGIGSINFEMFCAAPGPSVLPARRAPPAQKRARTSSWTLLDCTTRC